MLDTVKRITMMGQCPLCGTQWTISCSLDQFTRYLEGNQNVQDIFPELDATDREKLITGWCTTCQDRMFDACEEPEDEADDEGIVWIP